MVVESKPVHGLMGSVCLSVAAAKASIQQLLVPIESVNPPGISGIVLVGKNPRVSAIKHTVAKPSSRMRLFVLMAAAVYSRFNLTTGTRKLQHPVAVDLLLNPYRCLLYSAFSITLFIIFPMLFYLLPFNESL